jgi:hypothetical protein
MQTESEGYQLSDEAKELGIKSITDRSISAVFVKLDGVKLTVDYAKDNWKSAIRQDLKDIGINGKVAQVLTKNLINIEPLKTDAILAAKESENNKVSAIVQDNDNGKDKLVKLTKDLTREITFKDVQTILSKSIKKDDAPKIITFAGMLLAQTEDDQFYVGLQAESAAGKSYIPLEVSFYFPRKEILAIASASPTAFYHSGGKWDKDRRALVVDLEGKILIFMDMPHFQLLERLRPLLSHDKATLDNKELTYMITDKNKKGRIQTKTIIIKGFCSVFFCSTKPDPDEQEKTRLILLSPSVDQDKLRESLELLTLRKSDPEKYKKKILQDHKRIWLMKRILAIRQGGIKEIVIPNEGKDVLKLFNDKHQYLSPRHQRDYPRLFSFIKAHALLNCFNREKVRDNTILATDKDIEEGFKLYEMIGESNELGLSPHLLQIYTDIIVPLLELEKTKYKDLGIESKDILRQYYNVRHKPLSPETLRKEILPQLEVVGLIRLEPDPNNKSRKLVHSPTVSTPDIPPFEKKSREVPENSKEEVIGGLDSGVTSGGSTIEDNREGKSRENITGGKNETSRYFLQKTEPFSQQQLLLQKPKVTEGEHLFFGQAWVAWDLEWYPNTTKIYAAAFVNYRGEFQIMHISDYNGDEGQLLDAIVAEILKYPVSFGYYSTGLEINGKGRFSDLDTLAKALARNKRRNPIDLYMPDRGYGRERPRFKEYTNHVHFDLYNIFDNEVIKGFLEEEKYKIRTATTLDYVSKIITGQGKLEGLNGLKVLSENVDVQKNYVLWDAANVHNIIETKIMTDAFTILQEFADAMNATLEWVCHTTTTNWWTKIFDDLGCTRPTGYRKGEYPGGLVLESKSGHYENVSLVDVSSLYPSMAIIHNLGHDSCLCSCCKDDPAARVPQDVLIDPDGNPINERYWVCRKKVSIYRDQLLKFREKKDEADRLGQKLRKKAFKLLMNSSYGTWAAAGYSYLCPPVAILIAAWGRYTLRVMHKVATDMGLDSIAGDTDSLFLASLKTKKQFKEFVEACNDILKVHDPITKETWDVEIDNEDGGDESQLPITFAHFWNMKKKHYYYIDTKGKFDSTKLEVEKDDRVPYSATVLWKQWGKDLEDGKDPIPNLQRLTSDGELRCILEREPNLLMNSQRLEKDPGYINEETGELYECEYSNPFGTPQVLVARELGLRKHDIVYFFKAGDNKGKVDEDTNKPIGTYTANPKYADISKIKEDIANSFMDIIKVYKGYSIEPNKEIEQKIKREVFGLGD